jgi:hypothetical protein
MGRELLFHRIRQPYVLRRYGTTSKVGDGTWTSPHHRDFGDALLSEDAAGDEVSRRGGPNVKWCTATDCGAQIPYAAAQCAEGHAVNHINAGTYSHGTSRRPAFTLITGGKR